MDIEIKFSMGELSYSIDVNKKYIEELKDLYKALIKIGALQYENAERFQQAQQSLVTAANAVNRSTSAVSLRSSSRPSTSMPLTGCNRLVRATYVKTSSRCSRNSSKTNAATSDNALKDKSPVLDSFCC